MKIFRVFVIILFWCLFTGYGADPVTSLWATLGGEVGLICPFSTSIAGDRAIIVLWLKGKESETIYSYDARNSSLLSGVHWQDENILGSRGHLKMTSSEGELTIKSVNERDHAVYKCRVEYKLSSPSIQIINLTVILPPREPVIYWQGKEVMGVIGPFTEGAEVLLTCQTTGGRPIPSITWLRDGHHIESRQERTKSRGSVVVSSKIRFVATRDVHLVTLVCQALPINPGHIVASPQTVSVMLNLTLPPISVEIIGLNGPMSAETTVAVVCVTVGSAPSAEIQLWKGRHRLSKVTRTLLDGGNITKATASIHLRREDHNTNITCQAKNPSLGSSSIISTLRDVVTLDVYYEPDVRLELSRRDSKNRLLEGQSAGLKCLVQANPPAHRTEWFKDGKPIENRSNLVVSGSHLYLNELERFHTGIYRCSSENIEGKSTSNSININVKYSPICSSRNSVTNGVALGDPIQLSCRVEANPIDNLTFQWQHHLPNGEKSIFKTSKFQSVGSVSYLKLTPTNLDDFGTYSCTASNVIGHQKTPCVRKISPAGPPKSPQNCTQAFDSGIIVVSCEEGFDGGLKQNFHLQIWHQKESVTNITDEFAAWEVEGIEGGIELTLQIYASNAKGSSNVTTLTVSTPLSSKGHIIDDEEKETDGKVDAMLMLGVGAGFILLLIIIAIIAIVICFKRKRRMSKSIENNNRDGSSPDVISSIRNRPSSPGVDVLQQAHSVANPSIEFLSDCRGADSASNSSIEYNVRNLPRSFRRDPHMHSADFTLCKATVPSISTHLLHSSSCKRHYHHYPHHKHRHHHHSTTRRISTSAYQLSSSSSSNNSDTGFNTEETKSYLEELPNISTKEDITASDSAGSGGHLCTGHSPAAVTMELKRRRGQRSSKYRLKDVDETDSDLSVALLDTSKGGNYKESAL